MVVNMRDLVGDSHDQLVDPSQLLRTWTELILPEKAGILELKK
jgi:hypothetical protein